MVSVYIYVRSVQYLCKCLQTLHVIFFPNRHTQDISFVLTRSWFGTTVLSDMYFMLSSKIYTTWLRVSIFYLILQNNIKYKSNKMMRYVHDILILWNKIALKLFSLNNVYSCQGAKTLLNNYLLVTNSGYWVMFLIFLHPYYFLSHCHLWKEMNIFYLSHHIKCSLFVLYMLWLWPWHYVSCIFYALYSSINDLFYFLWKSRVFHIIVRTGACRHNYVLNYTNLCDRVEINLFLNIYS